MDEIEVRKIIREELDKLSKSLHPSQILPKTIKARHIDGMIARRGLAADRPTDGGAVNVLAYFATDTDTFSIWNGTAWVDVTLS